MHNKIFDEMADFIVDEGSADGRLKIKAFPETARGIVFAATLPGGESAGGANAALAGIEAKHDFTE